MCLCRQVTQRLGSVREQNLQQAEFARWLAWLPHKRVVMGSLPSAASSFSTRTRQYKQLCLPSIIEWR